MTPQGAKRMVKDEGLAARRRDEILRHAIVHFARSSYAEAELDAIAADVGCAKGTLYRYFESKEDLFVRAVDLVMRKLLEATTATESDDPLEQLEFAIRAYLEFFDAHPEYVELLIQERAVFRHRKRSTYFEYRQANIDRWRKRFAGLMKSGRFRTLPVDRALDVIGRLLYGTIFTNYFSGQRGSPKEQAEDVLDVLFHGLLDPRASAKPRTAPATPRRRR